MRTVFLVLLALIPFLAEAQYGQQIIDSMLRTLPGQKEDTNKVLVLVRLSSAYSRSDAAKGISAGRQAIELARHLNWARGIINSSISLGLCYTTGVEYDKALAYLDTAYTLSEKVGNKRGL